MRPPGRQKEAAHRVREILSCGRLVPLGRPDQTFQGPSPEGDGPQRSLANQYSPWKIRSSRSRGVGLGSCEPVQKTTVVSSMEFIPPCVKNSSASGRPAYRLLYAGRAALCAGFCTPKEENFSEGDQEAPLEPVEVSGSAAASVPSASVSVSSWSAAVRASGVREVRVLTGSRDSRYTAGSPESWA